MLEIAERLHRNFLYLEVKENYRNDYIRDNLLSKNYFVKDQTRQGESKNGNDSGELDLLVCENSLQQDIIYLRVTKLKFKNTMKKSSDTTNLETH